MFSYGRRTPAVTASLFYGRQIILRTHLGYVTGTLHGNKWQQFIKELFGVFSGILFSPGIRISRAFRVLSSITQNVVSPPCCCKLVRTSSLSWAANSLSPFLPSITTTLLQQDQQAPSHSPMLWASTPFCSAPSVGEGRGSSGENAQPACSQQADNKLRFSP